MTVRSCGLTAASPDRWFTADVKTVLAALVAVALLLATIDALMRLVDPQGPGSSWRPVGMIVGLSAVWLLANGPVEGRTFWVPLPNHGLTLADLFVIPPLAVAALIMLLRLAR